MPALEYMEQLLEIMTSLARGAGQPGPGPSDELPASIAKGGVFGADADAVVADLRDVLGRRYAELAGFFHVAAAAGQCTLFWAS